jgi:HAMP domain-containing protein
MPCLVILLFSGIEQRNHLVEMSKSDILLLTDTIATAQKEITHSTKEILSILSQLPSIQNMKSDENSAIFKSILKRNPAYANIALSDLSGEVLASGKAFTRTNLADRKHFRKAIQSKEFSVGEYIVTRVGTSHSAFPFALPVLDKEGRLKSVLTAVVKLDIFSHFYDMTKLPEKSFIALTDSQGIRLFYYPSQIKTNPIGKPIRQKVWDIANKGSVNGLFINEGSDGLRRIFAYQKVHLDNKSSPYLYIWAGIPEDYITAPANRNLIRNLIFMFSAAAISLIIAWFIGQKTLIKPIKNLVRLTHKFSQGKFEARSEAISNTGEIGILTKAFHGMADDLKKNMLILKENELRFRLVMDSLEAIVFVSDMDTYKILFVNKYAREQFGDVTGKICWQSFRKGKTGPCSFCRKKGLLKVDGRPGEVFRNEFYNNLINKWLYVEDRVIEWIDGQTVHLQVATDITNRKDIEKEREQLIAQLKEALSKIKTLSGFLPICAHCKKIRDDKGYWNEIESYIHDHSDAEFSHGMCPECSDQLYGDEDWYIKMKLKKKN